MNNLGIVKFGTTLVFTVLLSMTQEANANTLTFPETPVKQITVEGTWKKIDDHSTDPGKGTVYHADDFADELGVKVLDATIPASTMEILSAEAGVLSQQQIAELGKRENPWILRYCAERGKPALTKVGNKILLLNDFSQEQRIRIASPNGQSMCAPAGKYESHAFTMNGGKLVHIYLVRSIRSDKNDGFLGDVTKKFSAMLASIKW